MKILWIPLIALLGAVPAEAVVVTCVAEGGAVVRLDYSAADEAVLPAAFALDVTVDGGAVIQKIYDYKVGDNTTASRGFGIFPASLQFDAAGAVSSWGTPDMNPANVPGVQPGLGTSGVTLGMATRYTDAAAAPPVTGTLCRLQIDPRGAATVNVKVAPNVAGGGVVLANATSARFTGNGCTLGTAPAAPQPPASLTYPTTSSTGKYTVSWPASAGATSYSLERSSDNGTTWTSVYSGATLAYAETVSSGTYRYRVRATNSAGFSTWTTGAADCVVSISAPPSVPQPPATLTYPATSSTGQYTVSWSASTGATSYRLDRARNGASWRQVYSGSGTSYQENVGNGSYRYRVQAANSAGAGSWTTGSGSCIVSRSAPAGGAFEQSPAANGLVSIEAEHFSRRTSQGGHSWNLVTTPAGFSGTGLMQAQPDSGVEIESGYVTRSPRLDFDVRFVETGRHYIWVRAYAVGGDDDSCHAGLGGTAPESAARLGKLFARRQWVWTNRVDGSSTPAYVDVRQPGVATVNLWMGKDGFRLDKVVLTTDRNYRPTGNGPAESPRSAGPGADDNERDDD